MRYSVLNFSDGRSFTELAERWRRFEALGFDGAWIVDDLLVAGYTDFEPWALLAGLARETRRMRIGTLISTIRLRHPTFLAAQAITLDHASGGRAALGIGAGEPEQNGPAGNPPWSAVETLDRLTEQASILRELLDGRAVVHPEGYYPTTVAALPAPVAQPSLVIAAHGPKGLRAAARYADTWNFVGGQRYKAGPKPDTSEGWRTLPECVAETERLMERVDTACGEVGRDPATLGRSLLALRPPVDPLESVDAFDEYTGSYERFGLEEMTFSWPPQSTMGGKVPSAADEARFERIAAERILSRPSYTGGA